VGPLCIYISVFKEWEADVSTTCEKALCDWVLKNKSAEKVVTASENIVLNDS